MKIFFRTVCISIVLLISSMFMAYPAYASVIIDHTCTDISQVPSDWINEAKTSFKISYGHTSHGSQVVAGMNVLRDLSGSLYDFNSSGSDGALSFHDNEPNGDLGNPDRVTWAQRTRDLLDSPGNDRNLIMWSWCGQVSSATATDITTYLTLMNQLEIDYPGVTFIYMTGHLDGSGETGPLHIRNNQIRDYCQANNKILFDFADIESYDPDGNYFLNRGADDECYYTDGNWADEWCLAHPGECESCSCAHSRCLNCQQKGKAFWWMMARLAGWEPSSPNTTTGPTTSITASTTTTSYPPSWCPVEKIYGKDSGETQLLRSLRDNILIKSQEGRELIKLYYQWSPFIVTTMEEDEGFKEEVKGIIDVFLPSIRGEVE